MSGETRCSFHLGVTEKEITLQRRLVFIKWVTSHDVGVKAHLDKSEEPGNVSPNAQLLH